MSSSLTNNTSLNKINDIKNKLLLKYRNFALNNGLISGELFSPINFLNPQGIVDSLDFGSFIHSGIWGNNNNTEKNIELSKFDDLLMTKTSSNDIVVVRAQRECYRRKG